MAPSSPEGILIGNPRKPWRVGRQIGSGVCGTVHELEPPRGKSATCKYVIKIAPLPKGKLNHKKKKTETEQNANLLYYENLMYLNHFPHLQGKLIARVPPGMGDPNPPPFYGDTEGFRFIVMERMEAPLMDVVPALLERRTNRAGAKVPFGPVAVALLDCVEALHDGNHLFVDVKTENFMLAAPETGGKKRKTKSSLADCVRMIDLGLVKPLKDVTSGGHRKDEDADLMGTPLYASLNVHEGHTLSRRDDLEALGYVISELLLALIAALTGAGTSKKKTAAAATLPWSTGKSDEEIYELKKKAVNNPKSTFYSRLGAQGNADVARTMRQYFKAIQKIGYKEKPDYESLRTLLLKLNVSAGSTTTAARASKKPVETTTRRTAAARGTKRTSPRSCRKVQEDSDSEEDFDEDAPSKVRRVTSIDDDDSYAEDSSPEQYAQRSPDVMEVDDDFHSCQDDQAESMDWVVLEEGDENHAPAKANGARIGVKVMFTDGPHQGESFLLERDAVDTIVLGRNPKPKSGDSFRLSNDREVDVSHAKLTLHATKKLCSVRVSDLKSSSGTFVKGQKLPKGKERQAFIHDKIIVGDSTLQIQVLPKQEEVPKKKKAAARSVSSTKQKTTTTTPRKVVLEEGDENDAPAKANGARIGVKVMFIDGPHEGESFLLERDAVDTIVLGRNPKPKSGDSFRLSNDPEVDASHAKLVLHATKKLCSVRVSDLKSSSGTFVNRQKLPKGKERQVFIHDKIIVGDSTLQIQVLPKQEEVPKKKAAARSASSTKQKTTTTPPRKMSPKKSKPRGLGVQIVFTDGPHEGKSFFLEEDVADTFVLGTKPVSKKSGETFRLARDDAVDGSHLKLELAVAQKKLCTVKVTDLKSDGGTFVNGKLIPKGKHRQAFINDRIQVGDSIMQIKLA